MKAIDQLKAAGATVVIDKEILPESFFALVRTVNTRPYRREGVDDFLRDFGPPQYHSVAEYEKATGDKFPAYMVGGSKTGDDVMPQKKLESDPDADAVIKDVCAAQGGRYIYIGDIYPTRTDVIPPGENRAITLHPHDPSMAAIAGRILSQFKR